MHKRRRVKNDKMFTVICIYGFAIYILSDKKSEQFLNIIFNYIFQRVCLIYLTAVNI